MRFVFPHDDSDATCVRAHRKSERNTEYQNDVGLLKHAVFRSVVFSFFLFLFFVVAVEAITEFTS